MTAAGSHADYVPSRLKAGKLSARTTPLARRALLAACLALGALGVLRGLAAHSQLAVNPDEALPGPTGPPRHIYVVGCGHSGTSILKRSIANLPGLLCLERETEVYMHTNFTQPARKHAIMSSLAAWDAQAIAGGFSGWVEKSPRHMMHLSRMLLLDPHSRIVFIVRDGRDVAASMLRRGFTFEESMNRWVEENTAVLHHLPRLQLMTVKFEDFNNATRVLQVMGQMAKYVGSPATTAQLLMALQPPTALLVGDQQCLSYANEAEKEADLATSALQLLAAGGGGGGGGSKAEAAGGDSTAEAGQPGSEDITGSSVDSGSSSGEEPDSSSSGEDGSEGGAGGTANGTAKVVAGSIKGSEPDRTNHQAFRAWQSSQSWAPHGSNWRTLLTPEQQAIFNKDKGARRILSRFGYSLN